MAIFETPSFPSGSNFVAWAALLKQRLDAYANSVPGQALKTATVPLDRLAVKRSWKPQSFIYPGELTTDFPAGGTIWQWQLPPVDGATRSGINLLGFSVAFPSGTLTKVAANQLKVRKGPPGGPFVDQAILDLNDASLDATHPLENVFAGEIAFASGDVVDVYFSQAGASVYTRPCVTLYWSDELVSL